MKLFTIIFWIGTFNYGYAHKANEAFFTIISKDTLVEVQAEFPWSVRNALLQFAPQLSRSDTKEEFERSFFDYIKTNLILHDRHGFPMELIQVKELNNNGHSHQNTFLISFRGIGLNHISNTLMFNSYSNQKNYHFIDVNGVKEKYITDPGQPQFKLNNRERSSYTRYLKWIGGFLILLILAMVIKLMGK